MLPDLCPLVKTVLIGRVESVEAGLLDLGLSPDEFEIIEERDEGSAIARGVRLIKEGKARIFMEGGLDHGLFMREVLGKSHRRGASSLLSHLSMVEFPLTGKCAIITDTLLNHSPTLKEKIAIVNNALFMARAMGRKRPKVAALSALEYVNPSIPSSLDAAVLSKMSQRGQFGDARVEGPLDIDCAVSKDACTRKKVTSEVTGDVDIFLVPDVESGSCFAQFLSVYGNMRITGVVLGLPAPVILKSPAPFTASAIAGVAFASLMTKG
jgi:phosphate butyryltransferase